MQLLPTFGCSFKPINAKHAVWDRREAGMETISIHDASGRAFNARVDVADGQIILHSRSGGGVKTRNPDYRLALVEILTRLSAHGADYSVYLDSSAAHKERPELNDRYLMSSLELHSDVEKSASQIIRKSNENSRSNGAWRRILFAVKGMASASIISTIGQTQQALPPITAGDLSRLGKDHIEAAILEIREGRERPNRFEEGRKYRLIVGDGGSDLPPKKVFGIALAIMLERPVTPADFSSGEPIFSVLQSHGFQLVQSVEADPGMQEDAKEFIRDDVEPMPPVEEDVRALEGDRRLRVHYYAERSTSLPRWFRAKFKRLNGRLLCERCGKDYISEYGEVLAEACFDVHHKVPLSEREEAAHTTAEQLQLLCANCHRVTHREMSHKD